MKIISDNLYFKVKKLKIRNPSYLERVPNDPVEVFLRVDKSGIRKRVQIVHFTE